MTDVTRYPKAPGFKEGTTSREAAQNIAGRAAHIRGLVTNLYVDSYPAGFTADEAARLLRVSFLSIRPRVSELHASGMLDKTDERRKNESGQSASVWRASEKARRAAA